MTNLESLVGKIFSCDWGWNLSNCDFYRVIKSSNKFVTLQKLKINNANKFKNDTDFKPIRRKVSFYNNKPYISIESSITATLWK